MTDHLILGIERGHILLFLIIFAAPIMFIIFRILKFFEEIIVSWYEERQFAKIEESYYEKK